MSGEKAALVGYQDADQAGVQLKVVKGRTVRW